MASKRRRCEFCDELLPKDARPTRKFCDKDCRRGRVRRPVAVVPDPDEPQRGEVWAALEEAIEKATAERRLDAKDKATLAAARVLARKIDEEQARWDYCYEWEQRWFEWSRDVDGDFDAEPPKAPPKPPPMDNVSLPTFLRYCESLGLTPAGRGRIPGAPKEGSGSGGSKLGKITSAIPRPA